MPVVAIEPLWDHKKEFSESLNGDWKFKYVAGADLKGDATFYEPSVDVASWSKIDVPSNWEVRGFADIKYDLKLATGYGLYRKEITVPSTWKNDGRKVFVRFEGVAFGYKVWLNGKEIGESKASAYNSHTFEISDALAPEKNIMAVQVFTKPHGFEFDVNDDWSLSGIYRDVTIFSVPNNYLEDITTSTKLLGDGAAEFSVHVKSLKDEGNISGKLISPAGKVVGEFSQNSATIKLSDAKLWTAETPSLYTLELSLLDGKNVLQSFSKKVGLREVSIKDGVLLLNHKPIKLHGIDHHDIDPINGRAIRPDQIKKDLELMKKANINFVRTSHYAPNEKLIELCDEMGIYVMCEIAFGRGDNHLNDPAYHDAITDRVAPTIQRDKNHASVIVWSVGNENPFTAIELEVCTLAKQLDPTRPVCIPKTGSSFGKNYQTLPDYVDIYSPHYPSAETLTHYAKNLKRPIILTEYAHALGLATENIQTQWEIMQNNERCAGGAIWLFQDQGILQAAKNSVDKNTLTDSVWLDAKRFYHTNGNDGADGIVYSDRTPQTDFWQVKEVYSPIQIKEKSAELKAVKQNVTLTVENRYDFISLTGKKIKWSLQKNQEKIQKGEISLSAKAHASESVNIPLSVPEKSANDVLFLSLQCVDENQVVISDRAIKLHTPSNNFISSNVQANTTLVTEETADEYKIKTPQWTFKVKKISGELNIKDAKSQVLVSGIFPHTSRKKSMTDNRNKAFEDWDTVITEMKNPYVSVENRNSLVIVKVQASYPRPKHENESLDGAVTYTIHSSGLIDVQYNFTPNNAKGNFAEAGLSITLPHEMSEFRWVGEGPYAAYPGKDMLDRFGIYHLNQEDLYFQGNRRGVEAALLTTPNGNGVAIFTSPADVSVEYEAEKMYLSHNALISGLGSKLNKSDNLILAEKTPEISGKFSLMPLAGKWNETLTSVFGKANATVKPFKPFYHSYDQ